MDEVRKEECKAGIWRTRLLLAEALAGDAVKRKETEGCWKIDHADAVGDLEREDEDGW